MNSRRFVLFAVLFLLLGVFLARLPSTLAAVGLGARPDPMAAIGDVYELVRGRFVDEPDPAALQRGAIRGMLEALNDPYTVYVPPADQAEFEKAITGRYVGIGAEVISRDGWLTIVTPLEDSPALAAGLLPGDRVVEIEGAVTRGLTIDACIERIVGEPGTPVRLTIERDGARLAFTITRAEIVTRAVKGFAHPAGSDQWSYMIDPERRVAYLRLTQFTPTSPREFDAALRSLDADRAPPGAMILDLRGNPGGLLDTAVEIADRFLPSGEIVSTKGRSFRKSTLRAKGPGTLPDFPLIVLLDGRSASASEVLAGALADNGRAIVIGSRSFGKGSVQAIETLPHDAGAQVKITEQHWYTPGGKLIHRTDAATAWGVDPTPGFFVPQSPAQQTEQFLARRRFDTIDPRGADRAGAAAPALPRWSDPDWIASELRDEPLAQALRVARARLETGAWAALPGQPSEPVAAAASVNADEHRRLFRTRERLAIELDRMDRRLDALENSGGAPAAKPRLWGEHVDVRGGRLEVFDKDGNRVASLRIDDPELDRWLEPADLKVDAGVPATEGKGP
ncbi:MAG: S41 family peptidase [Phycisphaerae bacterium]|nr:S41 family peptidase [Phycisphaerae bacterium]